MMFGSNATRLARIDWSKYGMSELAGTAEPTNEQLKRAVEGLSVGIRQLAEELANMFGNVDVPTQTRAPFISLNYTPDAPGVSPDAEELEQFFPGIGGVAGDSYYDPSTGLVNGAQAGFFQGVLIFQPAMNNPNVLANQGRHRIVQIGGRGAGIRWENVYVENLYNLDGTPYSGLGTLPIGSVIQWAGAIGDIPSGWALMDGTANASGSGIDMRGQVPYGYSGAGDFATIGASIATALTTTFSGSGTVTTNTTGAHGHSISGSEIAAAVSINAHSGSGSTQTEDATAALIPSPTTEDFDTGSAINIYIWPTSGASPSVEGHAHTILGSNIASVLGNHTISTSGLAADADSAGDHSHTASISTIAGGLSIGTPSVVRPAGKVIAWIERIS